MIHNYRDDFNHIKLEPLTEDLIEKMRILRNKNRECFIFSNIITEEEQKVWFMNYQSTIGDIMFSIIRKYDNKFIGALGLYNLIDKEAEFGRLMLDKEIIKEKGYGYEAVICTCKIGFEQLNLERIVLEVFEDNLPAYKTYLKAGFNIYNSIKLDNFKTLNYMDMTKKEYHELGY